MHQYINAHVYMLKDVLAADDDAGVFPPFAVVALLLMPKLDGAIQMFTSLFLRFPVCGGIPPFFLVLLFTLTLRRASPDCPKSTHDVRASLQTSSTPPHQKDENETLGMRRIVCTVYAHVGVCVCV
jgi:hypothetical protein